MGWLTKPENGRERRVDLARTPLTFHEATTHANRPKLLHLLDRARRLRGLGAQQPLWPDQVQLAAADVDDTDVPAAGDGGVTGHAPGAAAHLHVPQQPFEQAISGGLFSQVPRHRLPYVAPALFVTLGVTNTTAGGRPAVDRVWQECFAQLVGTILSLWDASDLDNVGGEAEVLPTFINLTDAAIHMVRHPYKACVVC